MGKGEFQPELYPCNTARFRRVGAAFVNRDGAKAAMSIKLDFPVGATEFALFEPRSNDVDGDVTE